MLVAGGCPVSTLTAVNKSRGALGRLVSDPGGGPRLAMSAGSGGTPAATIQTTAREVQIGTRGEGEVSERGRERASGWR